MKYLLSFALCIVAASARTISVPYEDPDFEEWVHSASKLFQCFVEFKVDPSILLIEDPEKIEEFLESDDKNICFTSCMFSAFDIIREDGSVDVDRLIDYDETSEEIEQRREEYQKGISDCRVEVGMDNCELLKCLKKKNL